MECKQVRGLSTLSFSYSRVNPAEDEALFSRSSRMQTELQDMPQGIPMDRGPDDTRADPRRLYPAFASQRWSRIREVVLYVVNKSVTVCIVGVLVVMIGEIWARLPATPKGIRYVFDEELGYRYMPNQTASSRVLGFLGVDTPSMVIDENGFRNSAVDWNGPIILALGSSEVLGLGVAEGDIWTVQLERLISHGSEDHFAVYNAGTEGYGPYHSAVVFRRLLKNHKKPALVIVRASLADSEFLPLTPDELREEGNKKEKRDLVKHYTLFVPFLFAKAKLQVESVRNNFALLMARDQSNPNTSEAAETMWEKNNEYWNEIAALGAEMNIPVVFLVADPYGTAGGQVLFDLFKARFSGERCQFVYMQGNRHYGLFQGDVNERQKRYAETYTLKYDPHANTLQHKIIAEGLFDYLKTIPVDFTHSLRCSRSVQEP
jgi:hypothetical protein